MLHILKEIVIPYDPQDLLDWSNGFKGKFISGDVHSHVKNQPKYHFGEYFVLDHYAKLGLSGHRFYALGEWEPNSEKLRIGRAALFECFSPDLIEKFRTARERCGRSDGKGEPDVFLLNGDGQATFLEVKKGADRVSEEQLQCLAQIRSILGAEVGIVYLVEAGRQYVPKYYKLDLSSYRGEVIQCDPQNDCAILLVGAAGGSITLFGFQTQGHWHFTRKVIDQTPDLIANDWIAHSTDAVNTFDEALELINEYPWQKLCPLEVHSEFRARVYKEVLTRYAVEGDKFRRRLPEWQRVCNIL